MTANVANGSLNAMPTATTAPVVNSMDRDGASIKTGVKASSVQLSSPAPQHESKKISKVDNKARGLRKSCLLF